MKDLIDRRAAIKAIEDLQDCYNGFSDSYDKACIIGVLEEVPSAQPEKICVANVTLTDEQVREAVEKAKNSVLTVIESERKRGKWLFTDAAPHRVYCSECYKTYVPNKKWSAWAEGMIPRNFCPNCGALMKGEQE